MKLIIICVIILVLNLFFVQGVSFPEGFVVVNNKEMWSEKGICVFVKGCFVDDECYPRGYRKEGQYCSDKVHPYIDMSTFINQSKAGESCENGFECVSNFCFNGKCVSEINSLLMDLIQRISVLENKLSILELSSNFDGNTALVETEKNQKRGITGFIIRMFN